MAALHDLGALLSELVAANLTTPGVVFQIGLHPLRIEVLRATDGVARPRHRHADRRALAAQRASVFGRSALA